METKFLLIFLAIGSCSLSLLIGSKGIHTSLLTIKKNQISIVPAPKNDQQKTFALFINSYPNFPFLLQECSEDNIFRSKKGSGADALAY